MPYLFATQELDYSDYASGKVIYNLPGAPAFPVRLASEVFQRAMSLIGTQRRLAIFDPTCGAAYHLCALGFLHGELIESITASDIDEKVLPYAARNLGLLSRPGLARRTAELRNMLAEFGKPSHAEALQSASSLGRRLETIEREIPTRVFQANALDSHSLQQGLASVSIDLVFSDLPYGNLTAWQAAGDGQDPGPAPAASMLEALAPVMQSHTILAIASDKQQKISHPAFRRVSQFGVGKRHVTFLRLDNPRGPVIQ